MAGIWVTELGAAVDAAVDAAAHVPRTGLARSTISPT